MEQPDIRMIGNQNIDIFKYVQHTESSMRHQKPNLHNRLSDCFLHQRTSIYAPLLTL
jgi:hypothetical protein